MMDHSKSMGEKYYTIIVQTPDGNYSDYTSYESDPRIQSHLKNLEVLLDREKIGDNETIHKIEHE